MGRYLFGAAAAALGIASLVLHVPLVSQWTLPGREAFLYVTAFLQIVGGVAMLLPRSPHRGAGILLLVYLVFACTFVPEILAQPRVYASWGDVFYALGLVAGAAATYGRFTNAAIVVFGLCNISYAIEQLEFFARTAGLVPKWMPFGGTFWTYATTIFFAAAGLSLLFRYKAALASRLAGVMLFVFGVAIWIPMLIVQPKSPGNWSEGLETFALAGTAWIIAHSVRARARRRFVTD